MLMYEGSLLSREQWTIWGGECSHCGYSKYVGALEFHHVDPKEKDFGISGKVLGWERIKKELEKCVLLCSNCHREEHDRLSNLNR